MRQTPILLLGSTGGSYLADVETEQHLGPRGLAQYSACNWYRLIGCSTGKLLFGTADQTAGLTKVFVLANVLIAMALAWDLVFPINKSLWTSSFALSYWRCSDEFLCSDVLAIRYTEVSFMLYLSIRGFWF
ncbi:hypothetical protein [Reichenbachiella ulvae]|uniref:Uncharacterized protein n=1 Tax=Reichenbachiella ulvae TaxID=2980104 RepID=A0ABT3D0S7_9BACT|nr:hypothetical protein [Reichenbachiella ulvae]MCV9389515.1 hypothetical protein [Reichenbachiella ulvae]